MIRGRGATTCLICDERCEYMVFNNIGIIYGIKLLFDTDQVKDQYNIMLMSTKICIKCAGRLHQLFDFNLIKKSIDMNRSPEGSQDETCQFCSGTDVMRDNLFEKVKEAVGETKWSKTYESQDKIFCCFSCYNFLLLYSEIEKTFRKERLQYYKKIKSWKVVMPSENLVESPAAASVNPTQSNGFVAEPLEDAATGGGEVTQSEDSTFDNFNSSFGQTDQTFLNGSHVQSDVAPQAVCFSLQTQPVQKVITQTKSILLKRLQIPDSMRNNDEMVDKFSSIKLRRSGKRPIVLTPANMKKKKFPIPIVMVKTEPSEALQMVVKSEPPVDDSNNSREYSIKSTEELTQEASELEAHCVENSSLENSDYLTPPNNPLSLEELPIAVGLTVGEPTEREKTLLPVNCSSDQLNNSLASALPDMQAPTTLIFRSQSFNACESPVNFLDCEVEAFDSVVPTDIDLELFPQLDDFGNSEVVPEATQSNDTELVLEAPEAQENLALKKLTIDVVRLDPVKLQKILGNRIPSCMKNLPKISKSGRIWKPKIIVDPSTARGKKYKQRKIKPDEKKEKKSIRKPRPLADQQPKKLKTYAPKVRPPKVLKLQYPDEEFPNSQDIVEDFVEYSTDLETIQPIASDDDCILVEPAGFKCKEVMTKVEFLSPHYAHEGVMKNKNYTSSDSSDEWFDASTQNCSKIADNDEENFESSAEY